MAEFELSKNTANGPSDFKLKSAWKLPNRTETVPFGLIHYDVCSNAVSSAVIFTVKQAVFGCF